LKEGANPSKVLNFFLYCATIKMINLEVIDHQKCFPDINFREIFFVIEM
jgi:hypothetical protein